MNLKIWTKMRHRFGKSMKLSTPEHAKEFCNTECVGQAVRSSKIHGKPQTTCTTVQGRSSSCDRSPPARHETQGRSNYDLRQAFANQNSYQWSYYMVPFTHPTRQLFLHVFWRGVWFLTAMACMCSQTGLVGLQATTRKYGYLLAGMYSPPESYLSYCLHIFGPAGSTRDCIQSSTTALQRGVMLRLR